MMIRPPSYSDSFLILPLLKKSESIQTFHSLEALTPIVIPSDKGSLQTEVETEKPKRPWKATCFLLTFKGSFHLLLISGFETAFYFLYVNKSENTGILKTINTYYQPLIANCATSWSNTTRWLVHELLTYELNQTQIDAVGNAKAYERDHYNTLLLMWSSLYTVFCATLCGAVVGYSWWKKWKLPWKRLIAENIMFVFLLGLYEVFFFSTIIYNYDTLSTPELNQYIVDGLAQCDLQTNITSAVIQNN